MVNKFDLIGEAGLNVQEILQEAGITNYEELAMADDDFLRSLKGIGAATVVKIRVIAADQHVPDEDEYDGRVEGDGAGEDIEEAAEKVEEAEEVIEAPTADAPLEAAMDPEDAPEESGPEEELPEEDKKSLMDKVKEKIIGGSDEASEANKEAAEKPAPEEPEFEIKVKKVLVGLKNILDKAKIKGEIVKLNIVPGSVIPKSWPSKNKKELLAKGQAEWQEVEEKVYL